MGNKEEIIAYKTFKEDLTNKYGRKFEVGKIYETNPENMKFGEWGHGFHMASSITDTFRYFNPIRPNTYCKVLGFGKILKNDTNVYNSNDMYVTEKFKILNILSREDIIDLVYQADIMEFEKFLSLFPFTKEELLSLKEYVISKDISYQRLFEASLTRQTGDIYSFKRDPKYLRKSII